MAKKKVCLQHRSFGECLIKDAFFIVSSGSKFFNVICANGTKRMLLAAPEYWLSAPEDIETLFRSFAKSAIEQQKKKKAEEYRRDRDLTKNLPQDRRIMMLAIDEAEVAEVAESPLLEYEEIAD